MRKYVEQYIPKFKKPSEGNTAATEQADAQLETIGGPDQGQESIMKRMKNCGEQDHEYNQRLGDYHYAPIHILTC